MSIRFASATLLPFLLASQLFSLTDGENDAEKALSWHNETDLVSDRAKSSSKHWTAFKKGQQSGNLSWLPDFSYAGVSRGTGEKTYPKRTFNVTDFGAVPDDLIDDRASIEKTIQAAEAAGGGIVRFPPGRFLVMTDMSRLEPIRISSGNIVLKGSGSTNGGTIIHQIQPFVGKDPHDPTRMHLGKSVFRIRPTSDQSTNASRLLQAEPKRCEIEQDAGAGTFSAVVSDTNSLRPDDWVQLTTQNQGVMDAMLGDLSVEDTWTDYLNGTKRYSELHQIASIEGKKLTFLEPLFFNIQVDHNWKVHPYQPIANVGIEDICFMGNAYHRYEHHRSEYDDSGWSFFEIEGVVNSWIERVSFINTSQQIMLRRSAFVSMLNIFIEGNGVHHTPRIQTYDYGVLLGLMRDNSGDPSSKHAGYTHGPSIAYGSVGTVIWRVQMAHGQSIDLHSGSPYATLFDAVNGGILTGSAGGRRGFPQHLDKLIFWNFSNNSGRSLEGEDHYSYDFWEPRASDRFIKPLLVGLYGVPALINTETVRDLESPGLPVIPESLYEAQLKLRNDNVAPDWIQKSRIDFQTLSESSPSPHYSSSSDDTKSLFLFPENVKVTELINELSNYSLEAYNSIQFTIGQLPDASIQADRTLLRNAIYGMMCVLYNANEHGNNISAYVSSNTETPKVTVRLLSGKVSAEAFKLVNTSPELGYIRRYLNILDAQMEIEKADSRIVISLRFPVT